MLVPMLGGLLRGLHLQSDQKQPYEAWALSGAMQQAGTGLVVSQSILLGSTRWLIECGAYFCAPGTTIFWYLWECGLTRLLVLCGGRTLDAGGVFSVERYFRNARWLERELCEMSGGWLWQKRDRRALFLVPLLYWQPLRPSFPVAGFFELRFGQDGGLVALHTSWAE